MSGVVIRQHITPFLVAITCFRIMYFIFALQIAGLCMLDFTRGCKGFIGGNKVHGISLPPCALTLYDQISALSISPGVVLCTFALTTIPLQSLLSFSLLCCSILLTVALMVGKSPIKLQLTGKSRLIC